MSTAMRSSARPARSGGPRAVADAPAGDHTPGQPAESGDALRYLLSYNATNASKVASEVSRATGAAWLDAVQRIGRPFDVTRRSMLWWSTMADRREPAVAPAERGRAVHAVRGPARLHRGAADRDDDVVPTLVLPPQAGHSSTVVDFSPQQSQLAMIRAAGLTRVYALEWKPATTASKNVSIDDYLTVIDRSIRRMGGARQRRRRLPGRLAGRDLRGAAPGAGQHAHAGRRPDRLPRRASRSSRPRRRSPPGRSGWRRTRRWSRLNGGNMPGRAVLANFVGIQPQSEVSRQLQLLENIDDPTHVERYRVFEDWFKYTQDVPGAFYLWLVEHLFWKNKLISGDLEIGGRRVDMGAITCPLLLLAGSQRPHHAAAADVRGRGRRRHPGEGHHHAHRDRRAPRPVHGPRRAAPRLAAADGDRLRPLRPAARDTRTERPGVAVTACAPWPTRGHAAGARTLGDQRHPLRQRLVRCWRGQAGTIPELFALTTHRAERPRVRTRYPPRPSRGGTHA